MTLRDPIFSGGEEEFQHNYVAELRSDYPDAIEEIDCKIPDPLVDKMEITAFVDSDHAHDKVTQQSITGILIFIGWTPVFCSSKRQGAVETSTLWCQVLCNAYRNRGDNSCPLHVALPGRQS